MKKFSILIISVFVVFCAEAKISKIWALTRTDTSRVIITSIVEAGNNDTFLRKVIISPDTNFGIGGPLETPYVTGIGNSYWDDTFSYPLLQRGKTYYLRVQVRYNGSWYYSEIYSFQLKKVIYPPTIVATYTGIPGKAIFKIKATINACDSANVEWEIDTFYRVKKAIHCDTIFIDTVNFSNLKEKETFQFNYRIVTYCGEAVGANFYFEVEPDSSCSLQEKKQKIVTYPNPVTNNYFFISIPDFNQQEFKLFDMTGKLVLEKTLTEPITQISVEGLEKGFYVTNRGEKIIIR